MGFVYGNAQSQRDLEGKRYREKSPRIDKTVQENINGFISEMFESIKKNDAETLKKSLPEKYRNNGILPTDEYKQLFPKFLDDAISDAQFLSALSAHGLWLFLTDKQTEKYSLISYTLGKIDIKQNVFENPANADGAFGFSSGTLKDNAYFIVMVNTKCKIPGGAEKDVSIECNVLMLEEKPVLMGFVY